MAGALISTAQASPNLPFRTPAQLLAAVAGRSGPLPALTGTVVSSASLGLPALPGVNDPTSIVSLVTSPQTVRIWYADSDHFRLAVPGFMSESDLIVNGKTAWYWRSTSNSVIRFVAPPGSHISPAEAPPAQVPLTPQQAAKQVLAAVGPTTRVSVQSNVIVAGEDAYQLVLAPKSRSSLVGQVRIAVDATRDVPLRVQVYPRGATSPAFQVGYTSVSFVQPTAANYDFSPPPGAKVRTVRLSGDSASAGAQNAQASGAEPTVIGNGWLAVAVLPAADLGGLSGSAASASRAASSAARAAAGSQAGGVNGEDAAALGALVHSGTEVHGAWGSGQLVRTKLLSVLMTSDGRVLLGAVTPAVLYRAAAHAR
jgi:outer membrane lipoprotein-sorting protein